MREWQAAKGGGKMRRTSGGSLPCCKKIGPLHIINLTCPSMVLFPPWGEGESRSQLGDMPFGEAGMTLLSMEFCWKTWYGYIFGLFQPKKVHFWWICWWSSPLGQAEGGGPGTPDEVSNGEFHYRGVKGGGKNDQRFIAWSPGEVSPPCYCMLTTAMCFLWGVCPRGWFPCHVPPTQLAARLKQAKRRCVCVCVF